MLSECNQCISIVYILIHDKSDIETCPMIKVLPYQVTHFTSNEVMPYNVWYLIVCLVSNCSEYFILFCPKNSKAEPNLKKTAVRSCPKFDVFCQVCPDKISKGGNYSSTKNEDFCTILLITLHFCTFCIHLI